MFETNCLVVHRYDEFSDYLLNIKQRPDVHRAVIEEHCRGIATSAYVIRFTQIMALNCILLNASFPD